MKKGTGILVLSAMLGSRLVFSHGDHSAPGMIPPGLHGGVVKEATHAESEHEHDHDESGHDHGKQDAKHQEKTLFFEAVYDAKSKKISVFPLTLLAEKSAVLSPVPPAEVSIKSFQMHLPRIKKTVKVDPSSAGAGFEAKFEPGSAVRFFVWLDVVHAGEKKSAKIQIETSK